MLALLFPVVSKTHRTDAVNFERESKASKCDDGDEHGEEEEVVLRLSCSSEISSES